MADLARAEDKAPARRPEETSVPPLTERFAAFAAGTGFDRLDEAVRETARNCLIDWLAVVIAGNADGSMLPLIEEMREAGGAPQAQLFGLPDRLPAHVAALVNGTASEVHDYDDTYYQMYGHPSAAPIGAALALAEKAGAHGRDLLAAIAVGSELSCRLGRLVGYEPYLRGLSPTGTSGAVAAAAAAARVRRMDVAQMRMALSMGAAQAAGLHASGSSTAMQFQAGRAAGAGVLAADLVARGFGARDNVLEVPRGFVDSRGGTPDWEAGLAELGTRFVIGDIYFKFNASCGGTQPTISAARELRESGISGPSDIRGITIDVSPTVATLCRVAIPESGYDGKFSLRFCAAAALLDIDMGRLETFDMAVIGRPEVRDLMALSDVRVDPSLGEWEAVVTARTADGRTHVRTSDIGATGAPFGETAPRVRGKFLTLAAPVLGETRARRVLEVIETLEQTQSEELFAAFADASGK